MLPVAESPRERELLCNAGAYVSKQLLYLHVAVVLAEYSLSESCQGGHGMKLLSQGGQRERARVWVSFLWDTQADDRLYR